jgi:hypothetical protein
MERRTKITWLQFSMYVVETVAMTPADVIALQSLASQKLLHQQKAL